MNTENVNEKELLKSQGLVYTKKSKKLEDARSSFWIFICFGFLGLSSLVGMWADMLPIHMPLYMKILYTILLGGLFLAFILIGIYYMKKIKGLKEETTTEESLSQEIITFITSTYPPEKLDEHIDVNSLSTEELYFERYEKLSSIIKAQYYIEDEKYLDYLIEQIYQTYSFDT